MTETNKTSRNSFTQRALTAAAFVAVMLSCVYFGAWSFTFIFAVVTVLCLWELLRIFFPVSDWLHLVTGLLLGSLPYALSIAAHLLDVPITAINLLWGILAVLFLLFIVELFINQEAPFQNVAMLILAAIYGGLPFALLHAIGFIDGTYFYGLVMGLMLMTWVSDTGAYLAGVALGKTPLFPRISPKKTWEGTIGGVISTLLVAWALGGLFPEIPRIDWFILGGIIGVFAPLGDLVESMLKRSYGIKDSSNLLPGHGGALDRFDAFLFMLPFVAVYLFLIR